MSQCFTLKKFCQINQNYLYLDPLWYLGTYLHSVISYHGTYICILKQYFFMVKFFLGFPCFIFFYTARYSVNYQCHSTVYQKNLKASNMWHLFYFLMITVCISEMYRENSEAETVGSWCCREMEGTIHTHKMRNSQDKNTSICSSIFYLTS